MVTLKPNNLSVPEGSKEGGRVGWWEAWGTTVTWLEFSIPGCSPLLDEVCDLEVGSMLDDDQA